MSDKMARIFLAIMPILAVIVSILTIVFTTRKP